MKIPQMLLGAIALAVGVTIAVANSEIDQSVRKCTLPDIEMIKVENDTTKKDSKISTTETKPKKKKNYSCAKQPAKNKPQTTETTEIKTSQEPQEVERFSPEYCPACGMG